jgi:hypothetical protein
MSQALTQRPSVIAGLVRALCTCCAESQPLQPHAELDASRLVCPQSLQTYLDRGDGVFERDGGKLTTAPEVQPTNPEPDPGEPEVLSDRPARTGPKSRIMLERATFAGWR